MTKPTKPEPTKTRSRKSAEDATDQPDALRPQPAEPGTLANAETGAGKPAPAGEPGETTLIDSTLVGEGGGHPAAEPKPESKADPARAAGEDKEPAAPATSPDPVTSSAAAPMFGPEKPSRPAPQSDPKTPSDPARTDHRRRGGFLPLALGGAVAAGLGAAAALIVLPQLPPEWQPATAAAPEPAPDEAIIRAIVAAELAALPAPEPAQPQLPPELTQQLDAQAQQLDAQAQQLDAQAQRLDEQAQRLQAMEQAETPDLAPRIDELSQQLDSQAQRIEELAARPAFDPEAASTAQQQIEQAAADAEERLQAAQAEADALQQAAAESTRRAEAVAAIAALQAALDEGVTPEDARQRLADVGIEAPDALVTQVASLPELQSEYPEASRAALRASYQTQTVEGQGNPFTNFLRAQTGARSVTPREGDDVDAILSRANAAVEAGRIAPALDHLAELPAPARTAPAMTQWLARAEGYVAAQAALSDLSAQSN